MSSYQTIDLGTPYHDPASPLYAKSLRPTRSTATNSMPCNDYFSHKPRSFLPHADAKPPTLERGRARSRLVGYEQPILHVAPNASGTRVPRARTLFRLLLLCGFAVLTVLGWRCESFGCRGRGGGGLVGTAGFVGGGGVVKGLNVSEWGGERQGGVGALGGGDQSVFGAFAKEERVGGKDGLGELVGLKDGRVVEWGGEDLAAAGWSHESVDEEQITDFVPQDVLEVERDEHKQPQELQSDGEQEKSTAVAVKEPVGLVGELTGPVEGAVEAVAAEAVAQLKTARTVSTTQAPSSSVR